MIITTLAFLEGPSLPLPLASFLSKRPILWAEATWVEQGVGDDRKLTICTLSLGGILQRAVKGWKPTVCQAWNIASQAVFPLTKEGQKCGGPVRHCTP